MNGNACIKILSKSIHIKRCNSNLLVKDKCWIKWTRPPQSLAKLEHVKIERCVWRSPRIHFLTFKCVAINLKLLKEAFWEVGLGNPKTKIFALKVALLLEPLWWETIFSNWRKTRKMRFCEGQSVADNYSFYEFQKNLERALFEELVNNFSTFEHFSASPTRSRKIAIFQFAGTSTLKIPFVFRLMRSFRNHVTSKELVLQITSLSMEPKILQK